MARPFQLLLPAMWLCWAAYWWAASANVKPTARRESIPSRLSHIAPLGLAVVLLAFPTLPVPVLAERILPQGIWTFGVGALLTLGGLLFAAWARTYLGRNWSGIVTVKEGHELVTGGPYAVVRHPIYTGLWLAVIGSALARAEWRGVLAVALVLWAFWRKLRIEERWMLGQFGGAYEDYAKRTAALIPFLL